jgi:hypothetical protein
MTDNLNTSTPSCLHVRTCQRALYTSVPPCLHVSAPQCLHVHVWAYTPTHAFTNRYLYASMSTRGHTHPRASMPAQLHTSMPKVHASMPTPKYAHIHTCIPGSAVGVTGDKSLRSLAIHYYGHTGIYRSSNASDTCNLKNEYGWAQHHVDIHVRFGVKMRC